MELLDHLEEFRRRLLVSIGAWLVATIVAYAFFQPILDLIRLPIEEGGTIGGIEVAEALVVQGITTAFVLRIKLAVVSGIVLASPVILWQIFGFVAPGLQRREKRIAIPFFAAAILLFVIGGTIAYLMLPTAIRWLLGFVGQLDARPLIQFDQYVSFVTTMVLAFGLSFQLPLIVVALGAIGAVSSQTLRKKRALALILAFVIGAVATPGGDPLSQSLMALPLYLLYEASIIVVRFAFKK